MPETATHAPTEAARLAALDHAHLWHPFTAQSAWLADDPLVIERAEGVRLFDPDGRAYIDAVSSLWCNVHGHNHPALNRALGEQAARVAHSTLLGVTHPPAIELARRLVEVAPPGLTKVFYSDSGATAVEVALKMAFQYWRQKPDPEPERTLFLALEGAYHGDTMGDVSLGGIARFHDAFRPLIFPTLRAPMPHCRRCPPGRHGPGCAKPFLEGVETLLRANAGRVAAIVVEPVVQGAAGIVVHPPGYLAGLRRLADEHGTLLVADEVAVGFGRTGRLFACEHEGVTPDFLCLAKGITGGYLPLAATLTTDRVFSAFLGDASDPKTFFHGHTYTGNPLAAAVALASLDLFESERTLERMAPRVEQLRAWLDRIARHPRVGEVRQSGLMAGVELVADRDSHTPFPVADSLAARICRACRADGVLLRPLGDVLVVMPPLVISESDLALVLDAIERRLCELTATPIPSP
jgi:adenosylmethionine-8-amino-7-oxononanoate aminotransferase